MTSAGYTPAQVAEVEIEKIKAVMRRVLANDHTRIYGKDQVLLMAWAHDLSQPTCQHQNIEVYKFNADRFSGSCRDCGADVRSQA
jgi:hypothetical protein